MINKKTYIFPALPERRHEDFNIAKTTQIVLVKMAPLGCFFQISVGGSQQPDAWFRITAIAARIEIVFGISPADLGLNVRLNFGDFVKKDGAGLGGFKQLNGVLI